MPWFYVDDGFSDSKPVLNMPNRYRLAACGLWVLGGSWSAKEELDGFIPDSKLRQLGARPPILAALTDSGPMFAPLCERTSHGIQCNSWDKWQPTKAELAAERVENERKREADVERKRRERAEKNDQTPARTRRRRKGRNAVTSTNADHFNVDTPAVSETCPVGQATDVQRDSRAGAGARLDPTRPDPTRPDICTYVQSAPYESDATRERDDLSPPVNIGATRLVEHAIPTNAANDATRTGLRIEASQLLAGGETETDVDACLRLWLTKPGLGVKALKSLMAEVYKSRADVNGKPAHKMRALVDLAAEVRAQEQAQLETARREAIE